MRRCLSGSVGPATHAQLPAGAKISLRGDAGGQALIEAVRSLPAGAALLARLPEELAAGGASRRRLGPRSAARRRSRPISTSSSRRPARALAEQARRPAAAATTASGRSRSRSTGRTYDIATARRERYAHPGALPDVEPAPLREDLLRRDFTVNAIALALSGPERGRLRAAPERARGSRRPQPAGAARRELPRGPDAVAAARALPRAPALRDRAQTVALARAAVDRRRAAHGQRRAASATSCARSRASASRCRRCARCASSALDEAIAPGFGIADPRARRSAPSSCCPADGRRGVLALALAARGLSAPELRALLDELAFESRGARRASSPRRRAPGARRSLCATRARPSGDRGGGRRRQRRARRARRRARPCGAGARMADHAAPRRAADRRRRPARGRRGAGPGGRPRPAGSRSPPRSTAVREGPRAASCRRRLRAPLGRTALEPALACRCVRLPEPFYAAGEHIGIDLARRPRGVHDAPRWLLARALREPQPRPADRATTRDACGPTASALARRSGVGFAYGRQVHGAHVARRRARHRDRRRALLDADGQVTAVRGRRADRADRRLPGDRGRRRATPSRCCTPAGAGWRRRRDRRGRARRCAELG